MSVDCSLAPRMPSAPRDGCVQGVGRWFNDLYRLYHAPPAFQNVCPAPLEAVHRLRRPRWPKAARHACVRTCHSSLVPISFRKARTPDVAGGVSGVYLDYRDTTVLNGQADTLPRTAATRPGYLPPRPLGPATTVAPRVYMHKKQTPSTPAIVRHVHFRTSTLDNFIVGEG